jgi:hypothetical protein
MHELSITKNVNRKKYNFFILVPPAPYGCRNAVLLYYLKLFLKIIRCVDRQDKMVYCLYSYKS